MAGHSVAEFQFGSETRAKHARLCFFAPDTSVVGPAGFSKISDAYEKSDKLADALAVRALAVRRKRRKDRTK